MTIDHRKTCIKNMDGWTNPPPPYTQRDIALDGLRFARERGVSIIAFRSVM